MSMFFRNWLDEGFYEEDSRGDLTRLEDPAEIHEAKRAGTLYEHDGMGLTKVNEYDDIDIDATLRKK